MPQAKLQFLATEPGHITFHTDGYRGRKCRPECPPTPHHVREFGIAHRRHEWIGIRVALVEIVAVTEVSAAVAVRAPGNVNIPLLHRLRER